jgi:hypothetical protein
MRNDHTAYRTTSHSISLKFIVLTILLVLVYVTLIFAQQTYYIDPDWSGPYNGTEAEPFMSWDDAPETSNTTVLQKRGTICYVNNNTFPTGIHDYTMGAYGEGPKPKIINTSTDGTRALFEFSSCYNITINYLDLGGTPWVSGVAQGSSVLLFQNPGTGNIHVDSCILHDATFGIRVLTTSSVLIERCEVYNIENDGIYLGGISASQTSAPIVRHCYLHDINLLFFHHPNPTQSNAPGDCIQLAGYTDGFHIHDNILDRSGTGNKFCFIYSAPSTPDANDSGIFERNHCIAPDQLGDGENTIYLGSGVHDVIIRYNTFEAAGAPVGGIYNLSEDLKVYYNTFSGLAYGIHSLNTGTDTTYCYNNVFHNMDAQNYGRYFISKNNIYDGITNGQEYGWSVALTEDNNCYTSGYSGNNSITSNPLFVDPTNGNFHLQSTSPVINVGLDLELTIDKDGVQVPHDGGVELGAYEYVSGGTSYYYLDVENGTGDGSYTATTIVAINANAPGSGQVFDQWTGDVQYIDSPNSASANVTMPSEDITVTATYINAPTYTLIVNNGSGDGSYQEDEVVTIAANTPPAGQLFDQWTGDVTYIDNINASNAAVTMPAQNITVTATYISVPTYTLTVNNGSGNGAYQEDEVVAIAANTAPSGQEFDQWTGDVSFVDNVFAANTTITMPAANISVTATYVNIPYFNLTVNSGSGTGSYPENTIVNIVADAAPSNYAFYQWTGDVGTVDDVNAPNTIITIPTNNVSISATYTLTDTYFIDPENANDPLEDGTIIHPFDSWEDVNFASNSTYLQKRGTTCYTDQYFFNTFRSNILIGAYGAGERPIILSSSSNGSRGILEFAYSYNITIENLHISGTPYQVGVSQPAACVMFSNTNTHNIIIRNCELEHAGWGIRAFNGDNILIAGCEVHNIEDDGMYIQDCTNSEISYNNVHDINLKWFHVGHLESQSPGDCIQLARNCDGFFVHHNTLDRSNSGNKFCFIHTSSDPTDYVTGIFERNTCISPLPDGDGAASVFLGSQGHDIIIRYNSFEGTTGGIYAHSEDLQVYYNTFTSLSYGVWGMSESDTINVVNNMFYNMDPQLKGVNMVVKNNIFDLITDDGALNLIANLDESHNLYTKGSGGNNSIVGDPLMVDPENGDFHLLDNSPCIDYGLDLGFNIDHDSLAVPYGSCPELGSFEFYGVQTVNQPPNIASQNYSIDENSANGTFVCHVIASDPDDGQSISYSILGGNTANAFSINSTNGNITVNNYSALNFEDNSVFSLEVQVVDDWAIPLSTSATITINIIDVNEDPTVNDASFSIAENSSTNSFVGHVVAIDPDNGQTLNYSILSGNTNSAFQIGTTNGNILVQNMNALNFEAQNQFNLIVQVEDNGSGSLTDIASISISITDVNEAPVLADEGFSIDENAPANAFIGQLDANDPDNGQTLSYSILSGNINSAFQIGSSNGNITVQNSAALDFESWDTYSLLVRVDDNGSGPLFDVATITINLTDVNENPELDDEIWTLNENSVSNTLIGVLNANDPDAGQTLSYSIISGNIDNAFQINSNTGELSVQNADVINFEVWPSFNLLVRAMDNGQGNLFDMATVVVNLVDVNENPSVDDQIFSLPENTASGQQIDIVMADDPDAGQTLTYNIVGGSTTDAFEINESTGMLSVLNADEINFELHPVFTLIVEVEDNGNGNLTDQATIVINLVDVNENPIIEDQELEIEIPEDIWITSDENIVLGELDAFDPDQGQSISFAITNDNLGAFSIDPVSGRLSIANLELIKQNLAVEYEITVEVEDDSGEALTDDAIITININLEGLNTGGDNGFVTGVEDILSSNDLSIFPNPTRDYIKVEIDRINSGTKGEIVITDINGSSVLREQFIISNQLLGVYDMSSALPGVYLIHIITDNSVITKKFIVQ